MRFGLVIFDCDGVLVDTERLTVAVEARVLTELGWPHTPTDVVTRFMGRSSDAQLAELEDRLGPTKTRLFDELTTAELHAAFERDLVEVPGIRQVMDTLARWGVATCVASSGSHTKMRRTLGLTGLYDHFDGRIFSASEVEHGKPAPDLFLHAASTMGVAPSRCAVVEDSAFGVQAAVAAGMVAYGFGGGLAPAGSLADAGATVFEEMETLVDLLGHSPASIA
ncbi:MAG TPA: HAD family hydrolase [Nocardioidaceae bacterium]|nr:HAD family hydrolase [Nocardioidaceae bacterium]